MGATANVQEGRIHALEEEQQRSEVESQRVRAELEDRLARLGDEKRDALVRAAAEADKARGAEERMTSMLAENNDAYQVRHHHVSYGSNPPCSQLNIMFHMEVTHPVHN